MLLRVIYLVLCITWTIGLIAQDLTTGLIVNDLSPHPMQPLDKPDYLQTAIDPSFGTTVRRISNAPAGHAIVPAYSTIQAWSANEKYLLLYDVQNGIHLVLDGHNYSIITALKTINPTDLEDIFWHFDDDEVLYYVDKLSHELIEYNVSTQQKIFITNLATMISCDSDQDIELGNDIQMMSWDNNRLGYRCGNQQTYYYDISLDNPIMVDVGDVAYTAVQPFPSGERFFHLGKVYDANGNLTTSFNVSSGYEHGCLGQLANGNDAYFAVAFAEGPDGGCLGNIIAHDATTGDCFPIISEDQGYNYSQSGTHISALAHKNTEGGWLAASMIGYNQDGQSLLDQEIIIAQATSDGNTKVCRIAHHRADEDEFDYFGEPHVVISPSGTRVLFGSDWSGEQDGQSVDSYVVELPSYNPPVSTYHPTTTKAISVSPNPSNGYITLQGNFDTDTTIEVYNIHGQKVYSTSFTTDLDLSFLARGMYILKLKWVDDFMQSQRFIIE